MKLIETMMRLFALFSVCLMPNFISAIESGDRTHDLSNLSEEDINLGDSFEIEVDDKFEPFNRKMYDFNRSLDKLLLEPAANVYDKSVPSFGKNRVVSFFNNLKEPVSGVNAVLQGDTNLAGKNFARFVFNTIFGLGGLFDVAALTGENTEPEYTDFGLTLRKYGASADPYLVLPILGPSSIRDAVGFGIDGVMDPYNRHLNMWWKSGRYAGDAVNRRQQRLQIMKDLEKTSLDEYVTVRSIYLQKRR